jgi:hypothetical protein
MATEIEPQPINNNFPVPADLWELPGFQAREMQEWLFGTAGNGGYFRKIFPEGEKAFAAFLIRDIPPNMTGAIYDWNCPNEEIRTRIHQYPRQEQRVPRLEATIAACFPNTSAQTQEFIGKVVGQMVYHLTPMGENDPRISFIGLVQSFDLWVQDLEKTDSFTMEVRSLFADLDKLYSNSADRALAAKFLESMVLLIRISQDPSLMALLEPVLRRLNASLPTVQAEKLLEAGPPEETISPERKFFAGGKPIDLPANTFDPFKPNAALLIGPHEIKLRGFDIRPPFKNSQRASAFIRRPDKQGIILAVDPVEARSLVLEHIKGDTFTKYAHYGHALYYPPVDRKQKTNQLGVSVQVGLNRDYQLQLVVRLSQFHTFKSPKGTNLLSFAAFHRVSDAHGLKFTGSFVPARDSLEMKFLGFDLSIGRQEEKQVKFVLTGNNKEWEAPELIEWARASSLLLAMLYDCWQQPQPDLTLLISDQSPYQVLPDYYWAYDATHLRAHL